MPHFYSSRSLREHVFARGEVFLDCIAMAVSETTSPYFVYQPSHCSKGKSREDRVLVVSSKNCHKQCLFLDKLFQAFCRRNGKSLARKLHANADRKLSLECCRATNSRLRLETPRQPYDPKVGPCRQTQSLGLAAIDSRVTDLVDFECFETDFQQ
jgi:hypothetical protein